MLRAYAGVTHASYSYWTPCIRRATASNRASAFLVTPIGKRNVDLHLTAVRSRQETVIAVRKFYVALKVSGMIINVYVTGLMLFGPCKEERYGLCLGRKYKWLFAIAPVYAPAR